MSKTFTPKVVTANDLLEGDCVWLTETGAWTRTLAEAQLITDPDTAGERLAVAAAQPGIVVGAYLADAAEGPDGPAPVHFREVFRQRGPSIDIPAAAKAA